MLRHPDCFSCRLFSISNLFSFSNILTSSLFTRDRGLKMEAIGVGGGNVSFGRFVIFLLCLSGGARGDKEPRVTPVSGEGRPRTVGPCIVLIFTLLQFFYGRYGHYNQKHNVVNTLPYYHFSVITIFFFSKPLLKFLLYIIR